MAAERRMLHAGAGSDMSVVATAAAVATDRYDCILADDAESKHLWLSLRLYEHGADVDSSWRQLRSPVSCTAAGLRCSPSENFVVADNIGYNA